MTLNTALPAIPRPQMRVPNRLPTGGGAPAPSSLAAVGAFVALCAIWGSTWLAIKVGLRDLPPISFAGIRFAIAAVILYAIMVVRGLRLPRARRDWRLLL